MKKIVIIGGSIGGLITSILLSKKGYNVSVYEKNNYLGGCYGNSKSIELPFMVFKTDLEKFFKLINEDMNKYIELEPMNEIDILINPKQKVVQSIDLLSFTKQLEIFDSNAKTKFIQILKGNKEK